MNLPFGSSRSSPGQGGLEYLLLIGGVILVAILVLLITTQFTAPTGEILSNNLNQYDESLEEGTFGSEESSGLCGNMQLDSGSGEICDPTHGGSASVSCTDVSGYSGTQDCLPTCTGYSACDSAFYCGDGLVQNPPEECDESLGQACTPAYGGSCEWCNSSCHVQTQEGGFCGDGVCQFNFEDETSCSADCEGAPSACGDGFVTGSEVCDPEDVTSSTQSCMLSGGIPGVQVCSPNSCTYDFCAPAPSVYFLENSSMRLVFQVNEDDQVFLSHIVNKLGGQDYMFDVESLPFLTLETRTLDGSYAIVSREQEDLSCTPAFNDDTQGVLIIDWENCSISGDVQNNGFDIRLEVRLNGSESVSRWRISVDNHMEDYSIRQIGFQLGIETLAGGDDYGLITPSWVMREPSAFDSQVYPSNVIGNDLAFRLPYAYYDQTNNGIFMDHRFPFPSDNLGSKWWNESSYFWYAFTYFPSLDNQAGNDYAMNWDTILGVFEGDWYDLAQIHRAALVADDLLDTPLQSRADIPTYWKEADLSIVRPGLWEDSGTEITLVDSIQTFYGADNLQVFYPAALSDIATDLGDFDSFAGDVSTTLNALKQNGVHTSTYTHAHAMGKDTQAAALMSAAGKDCTNIFGQPTILGPYLEADVSDAGQWAQFYAATVAQDFFNAGLSGAFSDNPFAFPSISCYNDSSHPDGPGPHQMQGIVLGVQQMRASAKALNPDFIVFYEGLTDFLVPVTDTSIGTFPLRRYDNLGLLENVLSVPFLEVIYHDYSPQVIPPLFYENTGPAFLDYDLLDATTAGSFAWGQIMATGEYYLAENETPIHEIETLFDLQTTPPAEQLNTNTEYVKDLVALKKLGRKYLVYGRMLRPLDVPEITLIANGGVVYPGGVPTTVNFENVVPEVWSTVWRAQDGDTALVFANYNTTDETVSFDMDFSDYGLSGTYDLRDIQTGLIVGTLSDGDNTIFVPAKSALVLELE